MNFWMIIGIIVLGGLFITYFIDFLIHKCSKKGRFDDNKLLANLVTARIRKVSDGGVIRMEIANPDIVYASSTKIRHLGTPVYRWKIDDIGAVPRWYKSGRYLNKRYKLLKKEAKIRESARAEEQWKRIFGGK